MMIHSPAKNVARLLIFHSEVEWFRGDFTKSPHHFGSAMARYEMKGIETTVTNRGRKRAVTEKPNTESIVWSLGHLTLTRIIENGRRRTAVFSN